jgi:hypothetical protein
MKAPDARVTALSQTAFLPVSFPPLAKQKWSEPTTRPSLRFRDTFGMLRTAKVNTEVMVHPILDNSGRLVDRQGKDLKARRDEPYIPAGEMSRYTPPAGLFAALASTAGQPRVISAT